MDESYSPEIYELVRQLASEPGIRSACYYGEADEGILHILCAEARLRPLVVCDYGNRWGAATEFEETGERAHESLMPQWMREARIRWIIEGMSCCDADLLVTDMGFVPHNVTLPEGSDYPQPRTVLVLKRLPKAPYRDSLFSWDYAEHYALGRAKPFTG